MIDVCVSNLFFILDGRGSSQTSLTLYLIPYWDTILPFCGLLEQQLKKPYLFNSWSVEIVIGIIFDTSGCIPPFTVRVGFFSSGFKSEVTHHALVSTNRHLHPTALKGLKRAKSPDMYSKHLSGLTISLQKQDYSRKESLAWKRQKLSQTNHVFNGWCCLCIIHHNIAHLLVGEAVAFFVQPAFLLRWVLCCWEGIIKVCSAFCQTPLTRG